MSFFDDLGNFGSGLLDDVGEGLGNVITGVTTTTQEEASTNSGVAQQPAAPVIDSYGNAVTGSQPQAKDNTLLYVGGGLAAAVALILVIVIAVKK